MSYAIIRAGGKQYRVKAGDHLSVDLMQDKSKGDSIVFEDVLMVNNEGSVSIGAPLVSGAKVSATVIDGDVKGPKVYAFKLKRRKGYRKKRGHRQHYTRVKIDSIG